MGRTGKYQVEIPDIDYYQRAIKCQVGCPVRTDARGYVTAITQGDYQRAYHIAREANPLVSICGRICNAPCEDACRRGDLDAPIAIRALKRFVAERYGVEALRPGEEKPSLPQEAPSGSTEPSSRDFVELSRDAQAEGLAEVDSITARDLTALRRLAAQSGRKKGRVAVIGSGPAGLSVAHDLALLGHQVTLFESSSTPGGMIRMGVPLYRLSRDLLDLEFQTILDLGMELRFNTTVGEDLSLADLRRDFDAVFIGVGLGKGRDLRIEGNDLDGVFKAVDFLLNVNAGYRVELGQKVIVIGGGNVAVDAARMAMRAKVAEADLAAITPEEIRRLLVEVRETIPELAGFEPTDGGVMRVAFDVARTALRLGVAEVHMMALESWEELPASELEIEEALEEGIEIHTRLGPNRILGRDGKVVGLETIQVRSVFDQEGRFNPTFIPGTEAVMDGDTVILAIGQAADFSFLKGAEEIEVSPRGLIIADPVTGATSAPGVYAGGDVVYGPRILIEAVRDGQRAARAIDAYLQGKTMKVVKRGRMTPLPDHRMPEGYTVRPRQKVPTLPLDRRIGIAEVELGYDEAMAVEQAERCLKCGVNTVFDASKCILCNGCVDVCPWNCLKIVHLADLAGDEHLEQVVEARYGVPLEAFDQPGAPPAAAMLKDETLCTRCGLCAQRCPTGAITMEAFQFEEQLVYE
ncbi:MAG: FAD-dependent oxidoreductase [Anaerolineae bacterium]